MLCNLIIAHGQYLGVTCGYQYSAQLTGPLTYPEQFNISLYNPDPSAPNNTWDSWAEQLAQAGVDYVCPNLTGSQPNSRNNPTNMLPLLTALANRGLTNRIKFAIFDDNAASWVAQWNQANGNGFGYAQKFDMADTNNWKYIYDYNYKLFYQAIPDANRFKIKGRPLIVIWTGNTVTFLTNMQGNASRAMTYVRQSCQRDFGFNPYIVLSSDFLSNDTTCNNPGIADGAESWFVGVPDTNYENSWSLTTRNGYPKVGVAVSEFQHTGQGGFLDPNHGVRFEVGLSNTVDAGAEVTLCEGFTDYEEDAAMWRARNVDVNGNVLDYADTLYDFPNQRINILREHSNWPFPPELKFEAEGCDYFGGANGGNGKTNYYRNGNIAIETTSDVGGGHDIESIQAGEWFEWEEIPIQGSRIHLQARVATPNDNCQLHFVIDGIAYPVISIPKTSGSQNWETVDSGPFQLAKGGRHTVRIVCNTGGFNLNYWQYHDDLPIGANIDLQSTVNSKWVSAASTTLNADASAVGMTETFTVIDASSTYGYGCVAFQSLADGNYVTADTNGVLPLAANASSLGTAQAFLWTDNADGTITLRALANSQLISTTNNPATYPLIANRIRNPGSFETFSVTAVSTNTLSFIAQPNDSQAATPISAGTLGDLQVMALDANNQPVTNAPITICIASGDGTISGNTALTGADGIAHFANLQIEKTGTKTLRASSSALSATVSASFNILPGPPAYLSIETRPDGSGLAVPSQNIMAGNSLAVYAITRDVNGNYVANPPVTWTLVEINGGVLAGDLISSSDDQSAVFTGHVKGSAVIQANGVFTAQSGTQTVIAGTAARLLINQQPSANAIVGTPFAQQPIITEMDAYGNPSSSPITVTETGGAGSINGSETGVAVNPVNGVGSFSGLYVTNMGTCSLTFAAGTAIIQSSEINVDIGKASQLVWTTQPAKVTNGLNFGISPILQTSDAGGNITTSGLPAVKFVSVSIYSGSGTLTGTIITNIGTIGGNGTIAFTNLGINATGICQLIARDIGNIFNPTNISAANYCQLWLDAADDASLTISGSTVSRWKDKSGRANDAVGSATVVTDPFLTYTSPGQAQTLNFNGSQELTMNLSSLSNSTYTILVMEVGAGNNSGSAYFIGNHGGFNTDLTLGIGYQTASQFRWQQYADDLNYNAAFSNVAPRQWTMNLSSVPSIQKNLYLNSNLVGTAPSSYLTGPNLVNGSIGYDSYSGDIAEVIVYNTSLALDDQTNLQNYLQNKWLTGLSPAITQPFSIVAPVYQPMISSAFARNAEGVLANIILMGTGGAANQSYRILSTTNLSAPLAEWEPLTTNYFNTGGSFSNTIPVQPDEPARFYRLIQP